jgi:hypothetical protein
MSQPSKHLSSAQNRELMLQKEEAAAKVTKIDSLFKGSNPQNRQNAG